MPDQDIELITKEQLHSELRKSHKNLIILDCRSSNEYAESHIRSSVNFSIPSIMLRRFAAGKIDITSTIKCRDLKERILSCYKESLFVLYNNCNDVIVNDPGYNNQANNDTTINVLHRKLKQDGCHVVCLEGGYADFRQSFPEWCEDEVVNANVQAAVSASEQLMGLSSLRISMPLSDSACSSSNESSDGETTGQKKFVVQVPICDEPAEIIPGLFLGSFRNCENRKTLEKYNITYVLNVTSNLPNVFEEEGRIKYCQIPVTDHWSSDLLKHFPEAFKFLDEARANNAHVLVHCLAGLSRSVTVVLAYMMKTSALRLEEAFTFVRARKADISPNFHFMEQLVAYERSLYCDYANQQQQQQMQQQRGRILSSAPSSSSSTSSSSVAALLAHNNRNNERHYNRHIDKYSCTCFETECKCSNTFDLLGPLSGISPDSGIEFDRWTPSSSTPK
uniref:Putative mitogen-activated protein kinase phosphatase 3 n=1 Tax=Corethrella appendiculata TaxID=1370023 RepID=U5EXJ8_9DIPT